MKLLTDWQFGSITATFQELKILIQRTEFTQLLIQLVKYKSFKTDQNLDVSKSTYGGESY